MQRCVCWSRRVLATRAVQARPLCHGSVHGGRRFGATTIPLAEHLNSGRPKTERKSPTYLSDDLLPPFEQRKDVTAWTARLASVLPSGLRPTDVTDSADTVRVALSLEDVPNLLGVARRGHSYNHDLLLSLSAEGRWKEVKWLITSLVDHLWKGNPFEQTVLPSGPWNNVGNLDAATDQPQDLAISSTNAAPVRSALTDLLEDEHSLGKGSKTRLVAGHAALGQIWQSLGNMILADAATDSAIKPEILEIIALLHNRGIMPDSIYKYAPIEDRTALKQPPTLHLLSSHILTSLSDAAWRAHEKAIVTQEQERGRSNHKPRPELPGSSYRVRVGGLGHEVWLELVLWASLQGGWVSHGAAILEAVASAKKPNTWSVLSWREIMSPPVKSGQEASIDWDQVRYLFDTGGYADSSDRMEQRQKVAKTVSSEVVTAYLDALISLVRNGVGERGTAPQMVMQYAFKIKAFLDRNNLGLESTSWDAIVQRIIESQGIDLAVAPRFARTVLDLSSYGEELSTRNAPTREETWQAPLPYLLDGTAASLGIAHRILQAHIQSGDATAALKAFEYLQVQVDKNKNSTLRRFFQDLKTSNGMADGTSPYFQSHHATADYPAFYPQLPETLLASLLDLATDAGEYDFGRWLLFSGDVDGPLIPPTSYPNAIMVPALIRFASVFKERTLLNDILARVRTHFPKRSDVPVSWLLSILESQLEINDWYPAMSTLSAITRLRPLEIKDAQLAIAHVARSLLAFESQPKQGATGEDKLQAAREIFGQIVRTERIARTGASFDRKAAHSVLAVMIAYDEKWRRYSVGMLPAARSTLLVRTRAFNTILAGVLDVAGSEAGRRLVGTLWRPARIQSGEQDEDVDMQSNVDNGVAKMPSERPGGFSYATHDQVIVSLPNHNGKESPDEQTLSIRFRPNISTIRAIFVKALDEQKAASAGQAPETGHMKEAGTESASSNGQGTTVRWAARILREMGVSEGDIRQEIQGKEVKR